MKGRKGQESAVGVSLSFSTSPYLFHGGNILLLVASYQEWERYSPGYVSLYLRKFKRRVERRLSFSSIFLNIEENEAH